MPTTTVQLPIRRQLVRIDLLQSRHLVGRCLTKTCLLQRQQRFGHPPLDQA